MEIKLGFVMAAKLQAKLTEKHNEDSRRYTTGRRWIDFLEWRHILSIT